jgi:serine/threonine-protein kinase
MGILDKFKGLVSGSGKPSLLDVAKRFQLDRHSYSGTMSKFHVALEVGTKKPFGIKFLDKEKLATFRARFKGLDKPEEGQIATGIKHERIVETYEFGKTTKGIEYILMEYIQGPGLNTLIKEKHPGIVKNRLVLIRQMAEAVQAVHEAGYIHRDICPRNFIVHESCEWLKLIDFGLTVPDEEPYRRPGNRTGTPQYMAPEIVRRRPTDIRVDVFALGVSFYRLLTFKHPWDSTDTTGLGALAHDQRPATDILKHRPDLHPRLARAIHKCLEIKPDDRMPNCKSFLSQIRSVTSETV